VHVRLLAVGDRQPPWVDTAFNEYQARLPRQWQFRLQTVAAAPRRKGAAPDAACAKEGAKLLASIRPAEYVIILDERGSEFSSRQFAQKLDHWQAVGDDLVFVIGGPDGVSAEVAERADFVWSLSQLTLPHGLARVTVAEQLYRAWSLSTGHPYHRD
jgi:23S rRNA (pseudouridine1915-N3)-methyltransferase